MVAGRFCVAMRFRGNAKALARPKHAPGRSVRGSLGCVHDCAAAQVMHRTHDWGSDAGTILGAVAVLCSSGVSSRSVCVGAAAPQHSAPQPAALHLGAEAPLRERRGAQLRSAAQQPAPQRRSARRCAAAPVLKRRGAQRITAQQLGAAAPLPIRCPHADAKAWLGCGSSKTLSLACWRQGGLSNKRLRKRVVSHVRCVTRCACPLRRVLT